MRVAAYLRVSTDEQAEKGNSLTEQRERSAAYCVSMGWPAPVFFIDDGYSAKNLNRPDMQRLIGLVEENAFDVVVTPKLDRLGRNLLDLLNLIDLFEEHKCEFASVAERFDTSTAAGKLVMQILGAFAEFERGRISERVRDNMLSLARNTNKVLTLPCYGYDVSDGTYQINDEEAANVRYMFDLAEEGHGHRTIAKKLNDRGATTKRGKLWDQINVKRLMQTETLTGTMVYNKRETSKGKVTMRDKSDWIIKVDNHPAIIPKEQFERVQDIFSSRSRAHKHAESETYLLTGLIKCRYCGRNMKGSTSRHKRSGNEYTYYRYICSSYANGFGCRHHAVHRDDLESKIIEHISYVASASSTDIKMVVSAPQTAEQEIKELETQLVRVNKRMQKQIEAYEDDLISAQDLKAARDRVESERKKISDQLEKLKERKNGDPRMVIENAVQLLGDITGIDRMRAKNSIRMLIDQIEIEQDEIRITWKSIHVVP